MRSGTRVTAGRSLDCEAFDRFVDKAESLGLEVTLGAAHVPLTLALTVKFPILRLANAGQRCGPDEVARRVGFKSQVGGRPPRAHPHSLGPAGAESVWYRRTGHQTCC